MMNNIINRWMHRTVAVLAFAFFGACTNEKTKDSENVEEAMSEQEMMDRNYQTAEEEIKRTQVPAKKFVEGDTIDFKNQAPEAFKQQLHDVLQAYLGLKNALIAADEKAAAQENSNMMAALEKIDSPSLPEVAGAFWKEKEDFLRRHLLLGREADSIEKKRENFVFISQVMVKIAEAFGVDHQQALYVQYCPMANEGRGAYWVSEIKEIRNPFMGKKMLTCGETKGVL